MDLNHFYSQHQLSLMRADATPSRLRRIRHLATASAFARQIRKFQLSVGAAASGDWPNGTDPACAASPTT